MQPGDDAVNICRGFWNWHQKERVYELAPPAGPTNERIDVLYRPRAYILLHELMHSQYGCKLSNKASGALQSIGVAIDRVVIARMLMLIFY